MSKISDLAVLASAQSDDVFPIVDVHDPTMALTGTTKKITFASFAGAGATTVVPKPTGATAKDTPAVVAAIANLVSALSFGPATLLFQDGTYQVDSNSAVIRSVSNFAVRSAGRTVIAQAPNRSALPNNTGGDLVIVADCTDFTVEGITFDGMRDTVSPLTPLTASASSGQPSVTVAGGQGASYLAGQYLCLFGGLGSADQNKSDGFIIGSGAIGLVISSITAGGGSGGGDLITFTTNLGNTYSTVSGAMVSDGFGPYACTGAYLVPFQAAPASSVAGRGLRGEDQQNGLHLLSCQRFSISRCTARNLWESPFKTGTGFASTSLTDGCVQGSISDCVGYHAYDQGVSLWVSREIKVNGCTLNATGWAGICMTGSDRCTVTANVISSCYFQVPGGLAAGSGIVTEGGAQNQVKGNIIRNVYSNGIMLKYSPLTWGLPGTRPTLSAFLAAQTAAGASIPVSSTTGLAAGQLYSILDQGRSEGVVIASVVDSTHLTFTLPTRYSHASGTYIVQRIAEDNVFEGNTVSSPQVGNGIACTSAVRTRIAANVISNWALGSGGSGNGIVLDYSTTGVPAGQYLGGYGTKVEGNIISGGLSAAIRASWVGGLLIRGNELSAPAANSAAMLLNGVYDSVAEGNYVHDVENGQGIFLATGGPSSVPCVRVAVSGNKVSNCSGEGILALPGSSTAADSLTVTGNVVSSCGGHAGINLRGVTGSVVANNVANANATDGIRLEASGSVNSLYNRVTGNTARDDASGVNVTTGVAQTQQNGIRELAGSNYNLYTANECDSNAASQLTTAGASSYAWANVISAAVAPGVPPGGVTQDYGGVFGDGSDGACVLNGTNTFGFASLAGNVYTLNRDVFATSLSVSSGVTVNVNGWRVFCAGAVTNGGTIQANGASATSSSAPPGGTTGTLENGTVGGAGGTTTGTQGGSPGSAFGAGTGGAGGTGTGGNTGGASRPGNLTVSAHRSLAPVLTGTASAAGSAKATSGAGGGGGGGGDGTNPGGGAGAGAGIVAILAWSVVSTGTIQAVGGNGFTPVTGNCGGGGGGGGGLILIYTLSAWTAGTTSVSGGTQGSGVGSGTAGTAGGSGSVLNVIVQ
jgi:parallel beta-helix repeat protein